jgi:hypothetical protein
MAFFSHCDPDDEDGDDDPLFDDVDEDSPQFPDDEEDEPPKSLELSPASILITFSYVVGITVNLSFPSNYTEILHTNQ